MSQGIAIERPRIIFKPFHNQPAIDSLLLVKGLVLANVIQ